MDSNIMFVLDIINNIICGVIAAYTVRIIDTLINKRH